MEEEAFFFFWEEDLFVQSFIFWIISFCTTLLQILGFGNLIYHMVIWLKEFTNCCLLMISKLKRQL